MDDRSIPQRLFDSALFVFVPLVVHGMAAIRWLLDPFGIRHRILDSLLPELVRFPSATSRTLAFYTARTIDRRYVQSAFFFAIGAVATGTILIGEKYIAGAEVSWPVACLGWLILILAACSAIGWLEIARVRVTLESTRRVLRQKLTRLGLPTCIPCGYNLKGNASGRCPECGHAVK